MSLAKIVTVASATLLASTALTGFAAAAAQPRGDVWGENVTGYGATYAAAEYNAELLIGEGPCIPKLPPVASGQESNGTWWVTVHGICNNM